jgi:hypothetical protein
VPFLPRTVALLATVCLPSRKNPPGSILASIAKHVRREQPKRTQAFRTDSTYLLHSNSVLSVLLMSLVLLVLWVLFILPRFIWLSVLFILLVLIVLLVFLRRTGSGILVLA